MAKAVYVGVNSKARKMKKAYIGIGGKARKVKNKGDRRRACNLPLQKRVLRRLCCA